jgi:hypothetical protein
MMKVNSPLADAMLAERDALVRFRNVRTGDWRKALADLMQAIATRQSLHGAR